MKSTFKTLFLIVFTIIFSTEFISAQEAIVLVKGNQKTILPALHVKLPVQFQKGLSSPEIQKNTKASNLQNIKIDTAVVQSVLNTPKRYIYSYNVNGNNIQKQIEEYKNSSWSYLSKDTLTYDSVGNNTQSTWLNYTGSQWENASTTIKNYGPQNSLLNSVSKSWSNGQWTNNDTSYYTFNSNWDKVAYFKETWDGTGWVNDSYEIYTYNSNNQLSVSYRYVWQNSSWTEQQRYFFSYDANGNVDTSIIQNGDRQQWVNYYMETYTHDASNNMTSYLGKFWSSTDSAWVNSEQYAYTYNSSGYQTTATGQKWNNSQWVNYDKGQYYHDVYGGIESSLTQNWQNDAWTDTILAQYTFDQNGNATSGDYYTKNGGNWEQNNDGLLNISYNYNLDHAYFTGYHVDASYPVTTGINNNWQEVTNFSVGPNPATDYATLNFNLNETLNIQLKLFNLSGEVVKKIYKGNLDNGLHRFSLNLSGIPAGIYIATIQSGNNTKSVKIIHLK